MATMVLPTAGAPSCTAIHKTSAITASTPKTVTIRLNGLNPGPMNICSVAADDAIGTATSPIMPMKYLRGIVAMRGGYCNMRFVREKGRHPPGVSLQVGQVVEALLAGVFRLSSCSLACSLASPITGVLPFLYVGKYGGCHHKLYLFWKRWSMPESQQQWYNRQAIELLAHHIPFENDPATKAEQIEMLRSLVLRHGRDMDPEYFGFEAREELKRLGLWNRIGPASTS